MDLDLSPLPKYHHALYGPEYSFNLVKDHMRQFSSERYMRNIISCYRTPNNSFIGTTIDYWEMEKGTVEIKGLQDNLHKLFFPVWILLALIPEEKERSLTIENAVVAQLYKDKDEIPSYIAAKLCPLIGKGSLIIKRLTVVCPSDICSINNLKRELTSLGKINLESVEKKVDTFEIEVPILKGIYDSPHTMFNTCYCAYGTYNIYDKISAERILIATLGYGCRPLKEMLNTPENETKREKNTHLQSCIIDEKNFTNDRAPVYNQWYTSPWIIDDYTKKSKFVICQTTYCNGTIATGTTSKAIKWLREKWEETWNKDYDNLLVLIPYGGQYMEDEMIQIHKATDEGIIIVCAAGELGGGVVFPSALGAVLSVNVLENGPKGREVDIYISQDTISPLIKCHKLSLIGRKPTINVIPDCGTAAAIFTGLLALLLSRINHVVDSNLTDPSNQKMASSIKKTPGHLHTCVIRELLVSEGNGSHDPQLGYGDGEKIIKDLLSLDEGSLLEKLVNVLLIDDDVSKSKTSQNKERNEQDRKFFHNLDGSGIIAAVLDSDTEDQEVEMGDYETTFKPFEVASRHEQHGEQCAEVLHAVCPNATILCANYVNKDEPSLGFYDCSIRSPSIDIISYSISYPVFDCNLCSAVNEAVAAGKIIVFAAGNTGQTHRNTIGYPGRIGNILVVGGRDAHHNRIGFSAIGRELDFLAEGEIGTYSGTSYAAPVVAGYIALLLQFIKENMNTDQDKIRAWSTNEEGVYEWRDIPAFDAAHNVYAMRTLLKLLVPKPRDHSETEGSGCLDFSTLFPRYHIENSHGLVTGSAKKRIHETLQKFYKCM